jgi:ABC-type transport system substrate-binding protein
VAQLVAAQLGVAGIDAVVVELPAAQLFVDPLLSAAEVPSAAPTTTTTATTTTSPTTTSPSTPPAPDGPDRVDVVVGLRTAGGDPGTQLASDYGCASPTELVPDPPQPPSGFCDPLLQDVLESTAAGGQPGDAARLAAAEQLLWRQLPALPLFQPVSLVVSTPAADAATGVGPGALTTGPLADAARWRQPRR